MQAQQCEGMAIGNTRCKRVVRTGGPMAFCHVHAPLHEIPPVNLVIAEQSQIIDAIVVEPLVRKREDEPDHPSKRARGNVMKVLVAPKYAYPGDDMIIAKFQWDSEALAPDEPTTAQELQERIEYLEKLASAPREHAAFLAKKSAWFESINAARAAPIREQRIPGTRWMADGYCRETGTMYMFHECRWNGCLKCHSADEPVVYRGGTHGDSNRKTSKRDAKIAKCYPMVVRWECEV